MNRLLIVAPNWLGDAVMALPAIADVRRALPAVTIAVQARPAIAPLFGMVSSVEERVGDIPSGAGFDAALLLPNSFHSAWVVARAGIPERWGYRTDCRGFLLTRGVRRARARPHQIEYYRQLVLALGFPNGLAAPRLDAPPDLRERGARALRSSGWDGATPIVALAPGAAYGPAKRWPPASFAAIAAGLADDGVATVMIGSAADAETAAAVVDAVRGRAPLVDLVGRTDLLALAGVLVNCRTLIANDSGAMHLAAALGVSVVAVFGPTNERATAPIARQAEADSCDRQPDDPAPGAAARRRAPHVAVLTHSVWCRPCMLRDCPLDHACMRGIDANAVLDAARRSL